MCGLYILYGPTIIGHWYIASQESDDKTKLWNLRLGMLVKLDKQVYLEKDKLEKLEFCDNFIMGK